MDNEKVVDGLIELRKREKARHMRREHLKKLLVKKRMRCKSFGYRNEDNDKVIGHLTFPGNLIGLLSTEENSVICPYGIATVLAMVAEGASDESLREILAVLGYKDMDEFREAILAVQNADCEALKSENSLNLKKGEEKLELLDAFEKKMLDAYKASIMEQNSDGLATLELKNVATFKAKWLYKLERDLSHGNLFRNGDGSLSHPAYLTCEEDDVKYYYEDGDSYDDEVKAVALPYKLGKEEIPYEMVLVESK